jgi:RNA polymerase sigma-70 factor (ECF subfamily)
MPLDPATSPVLLALAAAPPASDVLPQLYNEHFAFVFRHLRRLGVRTDRLEDAAHDVFLVAHRRLADFEGRSSAKSWLAGIASRVAHDHRRTERRKGNLDVLEDNVPAGTPAPDEVATRNEAAALLERLLDTLSDDHRAVFVLAEVEQMTAPEIADALDVKLNTVYSRLRAARASFERALARFKAVAR